MSHPFPVSNPSTDASSNSKSKFYQATKARLTNEKYSSPLKNISPVSIGFGVSLASPQNDELSIASTLRFLQNTAKTTKAEANTGNRMTPTTSKLRSPTSRMTLNFNNFKNTQSVENKSATFSPRKSFHEKKPSSDSQRNVSNSRIKQKPEMNDIDIINQLYFSTEPGTEMREVGSTSLNRCKSDVKVERMSKSPISARRPLPSKDRKPLERSSKSPASRDSSKREITVDTKGRKMLSKRDASINNTSGLKTSGIDSFYDFESRKHSKSCSEAYDVAEQFATEEVTKNYDKDSQLKRESSTQRKEQKSEIDSASNNLGLVRLESKSPAFKSRIEELQYEKEQDLKLIGSLQDELCLLQNRVKNPQANAASIETQPTDTSPKSPEELKSVSRDRSTPSTEDLKQKEIDMLRIQNDNLRMTIEFLKNENQILKDAQRQSLQYKDLAIKYKELAETKAKECYILAEEVINLRKDVHSSNSFVLKPLYSENSLVNQHNEPWSSKLDAFPVPSVPHFNIEPEKALESSPSFKSVDSPSIDSPFQLNEEVDKLNLSKISPVNAKGGLKPHFTYNIYGTKRGEN